MAEEVEICVSIPTLNGFKKKKKDIGTYIYKYKLKTSTTLGTGWKLNQLSTNWSLNIGTCLSSPAHILKGELDELVGTKQNTSQLLPPSTHFTGGSHFNEKVEDAKDSVWLVQVMNPQTYI